jgi:hypothetical protein
MAKTPQAICSRHVCSSSAANHFPLALHRVSRDASGRRSKVSTEQVRQPMKLLRISHRRRWDEAIVLEGSQQRSVCKRFLVIHCKDALNNPASFCEAELTINSILRVHVPGKRPPPCTPAISNKPACRALPTMPPRDRSFKKLSIPLRQPLQGSRGQGCPGQGLAISIYCPQPQICGPIAERLLIVPLLNGVGLVGGEVVAYPRHIRGYLLSRVSPSPVLRLDGDH